MNDQSAASEEKRQTLVQDFRSFLADDSELSQQVAAVTYGLPHWKIPQPVLPLVILMKFNTPTVQIQKVQAYSTPDGTPVTIRYQPDPNISHLAFK